jgi:hypothetical protein
MALRVHIVCQNARDDRIIPRMARALEARLGWTLSAKADPKADVNYLSAYFESQRLRPWPDTKVAAYFTHREEEPPGNAKARLYDKVAERVDLRIATCGLYAEALETYGPTAQMPAPVETDRFVLAKTARRPRLVCGFSGYTYANKRKGEDLARAALTSDAGRRCDWKASGRGWPVRTVRYPWAEMPAFYQSLDVLVCTSRVEGIPMPPLEALACGASVVIPEGVGMLDELPDVAGIHRYARGDAKGLTWALAEAVETRAKVDREALRAAIAGHSVEDWCDAHAAAFELAFGDAVTGGLSEVTQTGVRPLAKAAEATVVKPVDRGTGSKQGIYCVAFGGPAREVCERMMRSAKKHMPEIPIALCSSEAIGPEDVLIVEPDADVGGRKNKLRAYELAPAEWEHVLYLDADTEVVGDIRFYFQLLKDGWEFVICTDPHLDSDGFLRNRATVKELDETTNRVVTLRTTQYNGGVWAFRRTARVGRFFARWLAEWEKYAQRDQGALTRAMYTEPLQVFLLGNEWNTFPRYTRGIQTAGLMHYPGEARRWSGMIPGRIDSREAWALVERYEKRREGRRSGRRR